MKIHIASGYYDLATPSSAAFNPIKSSYVKQKESNLNIINQAIRYTLEKILKKISSDIRNLILDGN